MNKILKIFLIILIMSGLVSAAIAQEQGKQGQVTVPLDQFLQLMNKNNKPAPQSVPPPPVTLVFGTADLSVTAGKDSLKVKCNTMFSSFHGGWNEISLIGTQAALNEVKVDGADMPVYTKDGKYTIIHKGAGRHSLTFTYLVSSKRSGNTTVSTLLLPPSSSSNLKISVPSTGINIQVTPSMGGNTSAEENRSVFKGTLPAGESVQVSWSLTTATNNRTTQINVKPRIYAGVNHLVSVSVGAVQITSQINLSIVRGKSDSFYFLAPKDVEILEVKSDKLQTWTMEEGKNGKNINVILTEKAEGNVQITVVTEKPLKNISSVWTVPFLQVTGAEQEKGFIACEAKTSLEMKSSEEQDINRIDVKELPSALDSMATSPVILAYRYYKHPFVLSVETEKHEELPVLSATIDSAQAITFVNDEGVCLTKVIYQMKNNLKQFLQIKLPEGAEIMNAFVSGSPVKPVKASDSKDKRTVLIPLRKSDAGQNSSLNSFAVEVSYKSKSGSFSFLGSKSEFLPSCDVQISEYYWTVYLPEDNRVISFGGNMKRSASTISRGLTGGTLQVQENEGYDKSIAQKIAPSSEQVMRDEEKQQVMVQNFTSVSLADNTGRVSGVLPVELYIPQSGQVFTFKKLLMEEGKNPSISFVYTGNFFLSIFCWAFLLSSLYMVIMLRNQKITRGKLLPILIVFTVSFLAGKRVPEIFSFTLTGIILGLLYLFITSAFRNKIVPFFRAGHRSEPLNI
ncbi:MAG: hypothetical protein ABRQ39_10745 [Candidatus Eremiobacterota bacterium]